MCVCVCVCVWVCSRMYIYVYIYIYIYVCREREREREREIERDRKSWRERERKNMKKNIQKVYSLHKIFFFFCNYFFIVNCPEVGCIDWNIEKLHFINRRWGCLEMDIKVQWKKMVLTVQWVCCGNFHEGVRKLFLSGGGITGMADGGGRYIYIYIYIYVLTTNSLSFSQYCFTTYQMASPFTRSHFFFSVWESSLIQLNCHHFPVIYNKYILIEEIKLWDRFFVPMITAMNLVK